MILDQERALKEALAAEAAVLADNNYVVPDHILDNVRNLKDEPHERTPVVYLVHGIATGNSDRIGRIILDHHRRIPQEALLAGMRYIESALVSAPGSATTAEALAFAAYELGLDPAITMAPGFDFAALRQKQEINSKTTAAGYARAGASTPSHRQGDYGEAPNKGWLASRPWLLELAIRSEDTSKTAVDRWWPLVIPSLLNYLDTTDLSTKARGVRLTMLLAEAHGPRLATTGLVPVFEDSITPCLSFVPPLVEPPRTMLIHRPAAKCLTRLAALGRASQEARLARLNQLARDAFLKPFLHTNENVSLTIYFLESLREFIANDLRELTIVHISTIVQVFLQIMTDAYVEFSPPLIAAAADTMAAALRWAWPRLDKYKYSIMLGLAKANALDTECFRLLQPTEEEQWALRDAVDARARVATQ